jgi:hypothetical protein
MPRATVSPEGIAHFAAAMGDAIGSFYQFTIGHQLTPCPDAESWC